MTSPSGDVPSSPESKRKAKEKIQADEAAADDDSDLELPPAPRFQTQAELDEWKRYYTDLRQIRRELGRQLPKPVPTSGEEGDVAMAEDSPALEKARQQEEIRRTHVYLFQFPPVLPDLKPITVKPDPEAGEASAMDVDPQPDASELDAATKQSDESHSTQPQLVPGQVGKLRVHKSGKATLDWGGTSMVLGMGAHATFLQNVIIANLPETKPKEGEKPPEEQDSAVAMGMGQIRGKFVLTPNWDEILG
jgi:DNA-directed RNA polymerase III subunit RPC4